jgi:hypothetical protein
MQLDAFFTGPFRCAPFDMPNQFSTAKRNSCLKHPGDGFSLTGFNGNQPVVIS